MTRKRSGGAGPEEPQAGREGLDQLLRALTAAPSAAELSGEHKALAAFRAVEADRAHPDGPAVRARLGRRGSASTRRPAAARPAWRLRGGFAMAAAAAFAVTIGAAYAEALPASVQRIAYHVLGFAGVPGPGSGPGGPAGSAGRSQPAASSSSRPGRAAPGRLGPSAGPSGAGRSGSGMPGQRKHGRPASSGGLTIIIAVQQMQVARGMPATFAARVRPGGRHGRGIRLTLQQRRAGHAGWTVAGSAVTSRGGTATVRTGALTGTTRFRFADGSGDVSATLTVTVVPPVRLSLARGQAGSHLAVAIRAAVASPDDLAIVQVRAGRGWQDVRNRRLGQQGQPVIVPLPSALAGDTVRVLVPATAVHPAAVSRSLHLPRG
jgi:hypothetical protein